MEQAHDPRQANDLATEEYDLRDVPLFAQLPSDEIAHLEQTLKRSVVPAHTLMFEEDDAGTQCYIVLAGTLEIVKARGTPDERVIGVRGPGELVGEMSLFNPDHRRTASVRTRSATRLLEMTHGDFDALLHRQPTLAYEIVLTLTRRLGESNNATIRDLQAKNRQLEQALADLQAAQGQIIEKEKLERELEVAWRIQESILPRKFPQVAGIDFDARIVPARTVGGDFFDFFPVGDDATGVVIGDVSGKGVPSAIFMALTRSLIRAEAERAATPEDALWNVNRHLLNMNDAGMFVTVLYGILDHATGSFDYVRAGHELPVLLDPTGIAQTPSFENGQPLGILDDPVLDRQSVVIEPQGALLLYTDGVSEAMDERGEFFGRAQLLTTVSEGGAESARSLCTTVIETVLAHQGAALQYDDITMVAIHRAALRAGSS